MDSNKWLWFCPAFRWILFRIQVYGLGQRGDELLEQLRPQKTFNSGVLIFIFTGCVVVFANLFSYLMEQFVWNGLAVTERSVIVIFLFIAAIAYKIYISLRSKANLERELGCSLGSKQVVIKLEKKQSIKYVAQVLLIQLIMYGLLLLFTYICLVQPSVFFVYALVVLVFIFSCFFTRL
ncbi:hypothetical protein MFLO_12161 [Listeria floridensis FSL S10-1187]|uniref:ABC transporter permease n=2 Tax=Listeria floridensis TaxID=1494962 RepID=A0ABP3AYC3_9LIST|nr:hypothetical protein MFLO_12161 [Listeria floridensis FSL S10-1187]